jgi:serine phosphatase RsbU (regulator of sigma subunit)
MTFHDRLVALGAGERESVAAETLLSRYLPVGAAVVITEAVLAAARDGDATLLASLFATMARDVDEERIRIEAEKKVVEQLYRAFDQQLPVLPSLGFSATYVPARPGLIGGDWYDAYELPDGRILFSIGDVAGHGVEAAVAMGRARQAILAIALGATDPGEVFERANITMMLHDAPFATAICGYVDPATLRVTYATAGHPPAIMVGADCNARHLDYGGLPLGVAHDAAYRSFEVQAEHGALLVLYTDGLLEYDRDLIAGERRILEAVCAIASRNIDNPAAAIRDAIFAHYEPTDDVAIMTIAFSQHPSDRTAEGDPLWYVGVRGVRAPLASRGPSRVDGRVVGAGPHAQP